MNCNLHAKSWFATELTSVFLSVILFGWMQLDECSSYCCVSQVRKHRTGIRKLYYFIIIFFLYLTIHLICLRFYVLVIKATAWLSHVVRAFLSALSSWSRPNGRGSSVWPLRCPHMRYTVPLSWYNWLATSVCTTSGQLTRFAGFSKIGINTCQQN